MTDKIVQEYKSISLPTIISVTPITVPSWMSQKIKDYVGCSTPSCGNYMLLEDYTYGNTVIPYGFVTDFASTGKFSPAVIKSTGRRISACHDWWYRTALIPKDDADELFRQGLLKYPDISSLEADIFYEAVHIGGSSSYQKQNVNKSADDFIKFYHGIYDQFIKHAAL